MYYKGGNMLHTIRQVDRERQHLAGGPAGRATREFAPPDRDRPAGPGVHQRARRRRPAAGCSTQYLTTTRVPVLEYRLRRLDAHVPLGRRRAGIRHAGPGDGRAGRRSVRLTPTEQWQTTDARAGAARRLPGGRELLRATRWAETAADARAGRTELEHPERRGRTRVHRSLRARTDDLADLRACSRSSPPSRGRTAGCCSTSAAATRSPPRCSGSEIVGSRAGLRADPARRACRPRWSTRSTPSSGAAGRPSGPSGCG